MMFSFIRLFVILLKQCMYYEFKVDHRSYTHNLSSWEIYIKPEKNSGLNGIRTHDICDTGAVLYRLSYQAFGPLELFYKQEIK